MSLVCVLNRLNLTHDLISSEEAFQSATPTPPSPLPKVPGGQAGVKIDSTVRKQTFCLDHPSSLPHPPQASPTCDITDGESQSGRAGPLGWAPEMEAVTAVR